MGTDGEYRTLRISALHHHSGPLRNEISQLRRSIVGMAMLLLSAQPDLLGLHIDTAVKLTKRVICD
jgi:hypothetical protein